MFGKDGKQPLDTQAARSALQVIVEQIKTETGQDLTVEAVAEGFLAVAVEHMARAIKKVSVEARHDIKITRCYPLAVLEGNMLVLSQVRLVLIRW